jgi:hypothetical protein
VGSVWNGEDADVRAELLAANDGTLIRSVTYDGPAGDHDLFRDAAVAPSGEVVVGLASSRCPGWLKPLRVFLYRLGGGVNWGAIHRESNSLDDDDPYNYGCVLWKSRSPDRATPGAPSAAVPAHQAPGTSIARDRG